MQTKYLILFFLSTLTTVAYSQSENNIIPVNAGSKIQNIPVSTTAPTNGQVPQYNSTTGKYEPTTIVSGDPSSTNEGALGVSDAGVNGAYIHSNTSGSTPVQFAGTTEVNISEDVATNGGIIYVGLTDKTTAGSCSNCTVTFNSKGQATSYSNGSGGTGDGNLGVSNLTADDNRTYTLGGFSLSMIGSTYRTIFSSSGDVGISTAGFTPLNRFHIQNSGTSVANGIVGRGITLTANNATPPSIYFESPDLTDASQLMGINFVSNAGLGLWKLASYNDAGSTATVDNIITATHAGKVGLGSISSAAKLLVYEPTAGNLDFQVANVTTGTTSTDGFTIDHDGTVATLKNNESGGLRLFGSGSDGLYITSLSRVGINTSSPASILSNTSSAVSDGFASSSIGTGSTSLVWSATSTSYVGIFNNTGSSPNGLLARCATVNASARVLSVASGSNPVLVCKGDSKTGINTELPTEALDVNGNLQLKTVGNILKIKEGTNASMGTATLVSGTVTVSNTLVTANSRIFVTTQTPGGTLGVQYISARTAGASFTITSSSALDTSTVAWFIVEPAP